MRARYFHTARHLKLSQLAWYVVRRVLPVPRTTRNIGLGPTRTGLELGSPLQPPCPAMDGHSISFLNHRRPLDVERMDWAAAGESKLWRYNLHYFDYLHWPVYSDVIKARLIDSWIAGNPEGTGEGWEPYTVSLRTVNWMRYFNARETPVPSAWLDSLRRQVGWLSGNVEFHILGNHLVKNAKVLAYAGVFFEGPAAERLRRQGLTILVRQADEQFLADGGHFERSPMYHCIVLEDYLDLIGLLAHAPGCAGAREVARLRAAAERGLAFLATTLGGDGEIALFNDAAFGIAPSPDRLLEYGDRVLGKSWRGSVPDPAFVACADTGYFGYRRGGDSFLIDCGPVGPDYQPGHAHCDTLSYELCVDGRRMIVDSGVHDYEGGDMRAYARSTAAHNTVRIDGAEQSELWGAFRVARRARPLRVEFSGAGTGTLRFSGAHDGYRRLPGAPTHRRDVVMAIEGRWEIADRILGKGLHTLENYVHLHPALVVTRHGAREFRARHSDGPTVLIRIDGDCNIREDTGWYCPEFGLRHENRVLVLETRAALPCGFRYVIERV